MKPFYIHLLILTVIFTFSSCSSVEDAQNVADDFFEAYNTENTQVMETLLDKESVIDAGIKNDFYEVFNKHWQEFGKINSYKKYAFETNTNNGITTVLLKFEAVTESGNTVFEKIKFIKREEGFKIFEFEFNTDKTVI